MKGRHQMKQHKLTDPNNHLIFIKNFTSLTPII